MFYEGKINFIDDEVIKYFKDFDFVLFSKMTIRYLVIYLYGLEEMNDRIIFCEFVLG